MQAVFDTASSRVMNVPSERNASSPWQASDAMLALYPRALWKAFKSEHFAFIAIAVYLLLEYLRPEAAYPIFGVLPLRRISWMVALVGFLADRQSRIPRSPMNWLMVLLFAECAVSAYFAYRPDFAYENFTTIFDWTLIYFLLIGIVTTERRLYLLVIVYLLANLKMSQFGFFTWARRGFGFASWGLSGAGWFNNSGELGLEMTMFFAYTVCMVGLLRQHWTGWRKWIMYFMPLSALACVIASSSRGALLGTVAAIAYLSLFSPKRLRVWLIVLPSAVAAYMLLPAQLLDRFHAAGQDATSLARIHYWSKAEEMLNSHPFLGVGYFNWMPYYSDHYFDSALYWRVEQAHNTFLQIGAELGYTGLLLFSALLATSFVLNWQSERKSRRPGFEFLRALSLGMNAAGLGLVLSSVFLTAFSMPNYWVHFALTVAISSVISKRLAFAEEPSAASPSEVHEYSPGRARA